MVWSQVSINKASQHIQNPLDKGPVVLIGYANVRTQLDPFLQQNSFPDVLITGDPGVGKTHLAEWIAYERNQLLYRYIAPISKRPKGGTLVLLDECHLQRRPEILFEFMGQKHSTLIGATTRPELLDAAFASRFFFRIHLEGMNQKDSKDLIKYYAGEPVSRQTTEILASASAGNPRQARQLVETAKGLGTWDPEKILNTAQITIDGLTNLHLIYLTTISRMEKPTGIATLSTLTTIDKQTLANLERLLLKLNLIELTQTGRTLTELGIQYVSLMEETKE